MIRRESDDFLDQIHAKDRDRALVRLRTTPSDLSEYEIGLLGAEYHAFIRRREATQKAARETADRATRQRDAIAAAVCPKGITFRNDLLRRLSTHAIDLALTHRITVKQSMHLGACAWSETRTICVPPVSNEPNYAVFLHEVGHVVDPDADSSQYPYALEDGHMNAVGGELGAWRWAFKHALVWTLEMQERLYQSLTSHPAYARATPDERFDMSTCLTNACLRVRGKTWTFGELDEKCASLRGPAR